MQQLSSSDINILKKASTTGVINQFDRIKRHLTDGRWLGIRNVYKSNPIKRIELEVKGEKLKYPLQLADYIAVSSPTHLWDGWNYLGLALYSCICGYTANVKHLAYYAELRAAMSVLASQGIGIFRHKHFVVDESSMIHKLGDRGTHNATWLYLKQWVNGDGSNYLLNRVFQIWSHSFANWLEVFPYGVARATLGAERLLLMGFDIQRMMEDRDARNEASYRPTGIVAAQTADPKADAQFVVEALRLLEPGGSSGTFETIDRYIFRRVVKRALETKIEDITPEDEEFRRSVETMVLAFDDNPTWQKDIKQFLTHESDSKEPQLLVEAENQKDHYDDNYHLQVISRAMLLLRVATGMVREMLKDSGVDLDVLKFWWHNAGRIQGFWNTPPQSIDSSQLWSDFIPYLDDIDDWISGDNNSRQSLQSECAEALVQLTGTARFALIGLAS